MNPACHTPPRVCPCCGARETHPEEWCGCEAGLPEAECASGRCGNGPHHNHYGCGSWEAAYRAVAPAALAAECPCAVCHPGTPETEVPGPCRHAQALFAAFFAPGGPGANWHAGRVCQYVQEATHGEGGEYFHQFVSAAELAAELELWEANGG